MKYPFAYTIQGYNYGAEDYYLENGVGMCEGFNDAANILENYYKDELIAIKHLELYEESNLIVLPRETFDDVTNCLESNECFAVNCDRKGVEK